MAYAEPVLRPPRAACARVPEAQWRDGGWRGWIGAVALSKPVTKYLSNGATNPIHARYYCGGNNLPKVRIRAHPPPAAPPFAAKQAGVVWCRDRPSKRTTPLKRSMIAWRRWFRYRALKFPGDIMPARPVPRFTWAERFSATNCVAGLTSVAT